jgi:hypothetical protein
MPLAAAAGPEPKGFLCAQISLFNLHAARRVAPNDKQGKEILCRYILRPPLANERLHLLANGSVTVEFKRPLSDGTRSIGLAPQALISRMADWVPPPKRHVTVYSGVLASNSRWRRLIVPKPAATEEEPESHPSEADVKDREAAPTAAASVKGDWGESKPKTRSSRYIPWHELLRRTFGEEVQCPDCGGRLRLIALVKKEETIRAVLTALHYPTGPPKEAKASSLVAREDDLSGSGRGTDESTDRPEYPD